MSAPLFPNDQSGAVPFGDLRVPVERPGPKGPARWAPRKNFRPLPRSGSCRCPPPVVAPPGQLARGSGTEQAIRLVMIGDFDPTA